MKKIYIFFVILLIVSFLFLFGYNHLSNSKPISTKMDNTKEITIQTIEFHSHTPVTNVAVSLFESMTKHKLASNIVNEKGMITFKKVKPNEPYEVVVYRILDNGEWLEQTRQLVVYDVNKPIIPIETFHVNSSQQLGVPVVKQNPELPNGCEVTSLTSILNYYGIHIDKMKLAMDYLPKEPMITIGKELYGPNPNKAYAGDPTKTKGGYYSFPSPIVEVANQVLIDQKSEFRGLNISDASKEELLEFIQAGIPVLTWVTIDYQQPRFNGYWKVKETDEKYPKFSNLHAVVLIGYQGDTVMVMNPLRGYEKIDVNVFFNSYKSLGSHAMVVL